MGVRVAVGTSVPVGVDVKVLVGVADGVGVGVRVGVKVGGGVACAIVMVAPDKGRPDKLIVPFGLVPVIPPVSILTW